MSIKIGDVSKLFGLPVETIRFYEAENIINPKRDTASNYRVYETWDILKLMECIKYRNYDIAVKDVSKCMNVEPIDFYIQCLTKKQEQLTEDLRYNALLHKKLDNYIKTLKTVKLNLNNFWVKIVPKQYCFPVLSSGSHDLYDDMEPKSDLFPIWTSHLNFVDMALSIPKEDFFSRNEDRFQWVYLIESDYAEQLRSPYIL